MRLTAPLTKVDSLRVVTMVLCAAAIVGCASNSPRRPTGTQDKNASSFNQTCYDAQTAGAPPPIGCPQYAQERRRTTPGMSIDPLPTLPANQMPSGGLLRR